jgi:hypothetical protein
MFELAMKNSAHGLFNGVSPAFQLIDAAENESLELGTRDPRRSISDHFLSISI